MDGRKPNAFRLGLKLSEHYNNYHNQIIGSYNHLKVETILAATDLPTMEDLQRLGRPDHWEERIKDALENNLEELVNKGVISYWCYTKSKGTELTEEEAYNISDFETFTQLYIHWDLCAPVDHSKRIEQKKKDRDKAIQQKKKRNTKN